jgi:hypothetical protein
MFYTPTMRAVRIILNGVEWVAETRFSSMTTIRGFGDTPTHACKDVLRALEQFPARPDKILAE